jgi:hypothetical protein
MQKFFGFISGGGTGSAESQPNTGRNPETGNSKELIKGVKTQKDFIADAFSVDDLSNLESNNTFT